MQRSGTRHLVVALASICLVWTAAAAPPAAASGGQVAIDVAIALGIGVWVGLALYLVGLVGLAVFKGADDKRRYGRGVDPAGTFFYYRDAPFLVVAIPVTTFKRRHAGTLPDLS